MRRIRTQRDGAFIMAWVLIVILFLVGVGVGLMTLGTWEGVTVVGDVDGLQCFNLAEAGLAWGTWHLSRDADWAGGTLTLDGNECAVTTQDLGNDWHRVTAEGVVAGARRTLTQNVRVVESAVSWPRSMTDYGIYWGGGHDGGGDFTLRSLVLVNGPIFANGDMQLSLLAAVINGAITTTGSVSGWGLHTTVAAGDDAPEPFSLDSSWYGGQIQLAGQTGSSGLTVKNSQTANLAGATLYVDGDVLIKNNSLLSGPGRIVASGNITIQDNARVLDSVDLIAGGTVTADHYAILEGQGNTIYGAEGVSIRSLAAVNPANPVRLPSQGSTAIITPTGKELEIRDLAAVRGIVWAGLLDMKNLAAFQGSMYANAFAGNDIENAVYIQYDPTVFNNFPPLPGVPTESSGGGTTVDLGVWSERDADE